MSHVEALIHKMVLGIEGGFQSIAHGFLTYVSLLETTL